MSKRILFVLMITMAASAAFAGPEANEGYCIGIAPEDCPYAWAQNQGRWTYESVPQSEKNMSREGRDVRLRQAKVWRGPTYRAILAPKPAR